jgi:hypothetical protein
MKSVAFVMLTVLLILGAGVGNAQASTVCFLKKSELLKVVPPGQRIFYTRVQFKNNDHIDFVRPGPIGSKCWHIHYKIPEASHLPKNEEASFIESTFRWWSVPDPKLNSPVSF